MAPTLSVMRVNLYGPYNLCKHIVPMMREQASGSIINISSTAASGKPGQANYSATKAGLQGLTRGWLWNWVAKIFVSTALLRALWKRI